MTKRQKLGRGLGSLLGETLDEKGKVIDLELAKIHPNPWQPRRDFDDEALKGLADSIKEKGLIQPVTVRYKDTDGEFEYELVAGERRFRAAKMAGLSVIPAIITQYDDKMMAEAALIENLQREDLNPVEEASAYETIMKSYELTQEELAESVGKSRSHVANTLRLMDLPDEVKDMLSERKLTAGQARPLLSLKTPAEQISLARRIVKDGLSAREVEKLTSETKPGKVKPKKDEQVSAYLKSL
ncbi:ParB/RepB/Spo0J family partition protein, partial [Dialister hominis]